MKKLYIIGNGFDIAHGLKTSYWNFREYLENRYPEFLREFENLYNIVRIDFTDPRYSDNAQRRWENYVYHELWSEFENQMGLPNISEMMDFSESVLRDMDLDGGLVGIEGTMNDYWRRQYGYVRKFEQYVKEWIESVNTNGIFPKKRGLMGSADYFLTFNYTDLLEKIYRIDDVLHVHGGVGTVTNTEPIMGHCNSKDIEEHQEWAREADEEFNEGEASIHRAIANYLRSIYKDTSRIIWLNQSFWNKLEDVDEVIIIGWSAGTADLPYLEKVRDSISRNSKWCAYYYDDNAYRSLRNAMMDEHIEGEFEVNYIQSNAFWD